MQVSNISYPAASPTLFSGGVSTAEPTSATSSNSVSQPAVSDNLHLTVRGAKNAPREVNLIAQFGGFPDVVGGVTDALAGLGNDIKDKIKNISKKIERLYDTAAEGQWEVRQIFEKYGPVRGAVLAEVFAGATLAAKDFENNEFSGVSDDIRNAVRHAHWQMNLTLWGGEEFAKFVGDNHETNPFKRSSSDEADTRTDYHNNHRARQLVTSGRIQSSSEVQNFLLRYLHPDSEHFSSEGFLLRRERHN